MNNDVFLSVIIPVYNAEKYLSFCLESILTTERKDIEIILVDDGSTDGSTELSVEFQNNYSNIKYIHQPNSGPSAARNKGLKNAEGEYIAFIDSDDYIDNTAFCHHLDLLKGKNVDIWASDFVRVADNGCVLDEVSQIQETSAPIYDATYLTEFLAAKDCVWNVWRYIFRRDFLEANSLYFAEGYNIAEDLELVVRALSVHPKMAFFHEPYYFYRVNYGASLTRIFSAEKIRQLMEMLKRAMEHLGDTDADRHIKSKLAREYILNLSALYEVRKPGRVAALRELEYNRTLMEAARGTYGYATKAVKLLGIPVAALLLYMMKRMKRMLREVKTNYFDRGRNDKGIGSNSCVQCREISVSVSGQCAEPESEGY